MSKITISPEMALSDMKWLLKIREEYKRSGEDWDAFADSCFDIVKVCMHSKIVSQGWEWNEEARSYIKLDHKNGTIETLKSKDGTVPHDFEKSFSPLDSTSKND